MGISPCTLVSCFARWRRRSCFFCYTSNGRPALTLATSRSSTLEGVLFRLVDRSNSAQCERFAIDAVTQAAHL